MRVPVSLVLVLASGACAAPSGGADCDVARMDAAPPPPPPLLPVDPRCRPLSALELRRTGEEGGYLVVGLALIDGVAIADFSGVSTRVRLRIGLEDAVVALTDFAAISEQHSYPLLCAIDDARDMEVRLLRRGYDDTSGTRRLAGPAVRVLRHSSGEELMTFDALPAGLGFEREYGRGLVCLAPERARDDRCCPDGACTVDRCGQDWALVDGCRWEDIVSPLDGFCHARVVF